MTSIEQCAVATTGHISKPVVATHLLGEDIRKRKEDIVMNVASVKSILVNQIKELKMSAESVCLSSPKDFSRNRKLSFEQTISVILGMKGGSLATELLDYYDCNPNCITASGFCQQRSKIRPDAFYLLFRKFLKTYSANANLKTYKGFRLFAVDGSDIQITPNENDPDTYYPGTNGQKPYALMHMNALYDLENRIYEDVIVQKRNCWNEGQALIDMMEKSSISNALVIADRGYESYNLMAHIEEHGWKYLIRIKNSKGITKGLNLPDSEEFDLDISMNMTRKCSNEVKFLCSTQRNKFRYVPPTCRFDFLPSLKNSYREPATFYKLNYRIVRLKVSETLTETIVTNLPRDMFTAVEIKNLYAARWGIETSFRNLKYTVGMLHFHSKKVEGILQEVYAALIMYNFTEIITSLIVIKSGKRKTVYKANFSIAVHVCRAFLLREIPPPNIEAIIARNIIPVRPDREYVRILNKKTKTAISFIYRVA